MQLGGLPELPPHARYVPHANECYDWGTFGWLLLHSGLVGDYKAYKHFFFINSSVRGPFLPAYARVRGAGGPADRGQAQGGGGGAEQREWGCSSTVKKWGLQLREQQLDSGRHSHTWW